MNLRSFPCLALAAVFILLSAGCSKSPEEVKAAQAAEIARTTGSLLVKSNLASAAIKVTGADGAAHEGEAGQPFASLLPGKYAVTATLEGWPEAKAETTVQTGQATTIELNFPSGSLKLDTVPSGALVKLGKALLGKTPQTIPQLPAGETALSLEYPSWPPVAHTVTIIAGQEASATVRLPHGRLVVDSFPAGATVVWQGKAYNKTPLFFDPIAAGTHKLTLQARDFPPMEVSATVTDGAETKVRPILGTAFPLLDPAELLRAVWLPDDSPVPRATTGIYRPKNDVVKNLQRERLYTGWLRKIDRFAGPVKSYDAATGRVEFAEQRSELARYRLMAQVSPGTPSPLPDQKDPKDKTPVVRALYGRLTAVEEPAWPSRVITFELTDAEFLPEATP